MARTHATALRNRLESRSVYRGGSIRSDHMIRCRNAEAGANGTNRSRPVSYRDPGDGKVRVFLTRNIDLPPKKYFTDDG